MREVISKVAKLDGSEELKIELEHGAYTQSPHTITIVREADAPPGAEKIVDRCLEVANHCKEDHHWFGLVVYYNPDDMPGGRPPEGETGPTGSRSWTFNLSEPVFSVACYCER